MYFSASFVRRGVCERYQQKQKYEHHHTQADVVDCCAVRYKMKIRRNQQTTETRRRFGL